VSIFNNTLPTIATLNIGVLASVNIPGSLAQAATLAAAFSKAGANVVVVGEILSQGINQTYSAADATGFDGIIVTAGTEALFTNIGGSSTLFPANRPLQILVDGYRWGKPVGVLGSAFASLIAANIRVTPGVFTSLSQTSAGVSDFVNAFEGGLKTFKFIDRFPIDS